MRGMFGLSAEDRATCGAIALILALLICGVYLAGAHTSDTVKDAASDCVATELLRADMMDVLSDSEYTLANKALSDDMYAYHSDGVICNVRFLIKATGEVLLMQYTKNALDEWYLVDWYWDADQF